ncbi:hypothetical protein AKJ09_05971 [Labilithrix luteola]|uniref:Uncharacterized protein n=1 Tax=Labilithrix luteola TaxID=1391654 RepID=A0A0K1Q0P8_9BACT|nr:hypothetical protein AKJ09_05971 [Labilithrix luteola]
MGRSLAVVWYSLRSLRSLVRPFGLTLAPVPACGLGVAVEVDRLTRRLVAVAIAATRSS